MQKPPYIFLNFQPDSLSSCHPLQASTVVSMVAVEDGLAEARRPLGPC